MVGNAGKVGWRLILAIFGVVFAIACIAFTRIMGLNSFLTASIVMMGVVVMILCIVSARAKSSKEEPAKQ